MCSQSQKSHCKQVLGRWKLNKTNREGESVVLVSIYRTAGTILSDQMFFKSNTFYTVKSAEVFLTDCSLTDPAVSSGAKMLYGLVKLLPVQKVQTITF